MLPRYVGVLLEKIIPKKNRPNNFVERNSSFDVLGGCNDDIVHSIRFTYRFIQVFFAASVHVYRLLIQIVYGTL